MCLTYLLTEIMTRKPDVLDYVYVYEILTILDEELFDTKVKVTNQILNAEKENFDIEMDYTDKNLEDIGVADKMQPISVNYDKVKSKKIEKLIDKNFSKVEKKIKNQMLNSLNTRDVTGVVNIIETTLKNEKKSKSLVNSLMRVFRTESTEMRSNVKLQVQEELDKQGIKVKRRWVHTLYNPVNIISDNYKPRLDHLALNGVVEDRNGYFHTSLASARAPGMFGLPEEDINCRCDVEFILDE